MESDEEFDNILVDDNQSIYFTAPEVHCCEFENNTSTDPPPPSRLDTIRALKCFLESYINDAENGEHVNESSTSCPTVHSWQCSGPYPQQHLKTSNTHLSNSCRFLHTTAQPHATGFDTREEEIHQRRHEFKDPLPSVIINLYLPDGCHTCERCRHLVHSEQTNSDFKSDSIMSTSSVSRFAEEAKHFQKSRERSPSYLSSFWRNDRNTENLSKRQKQQKKHNNSSSQSSNDCTVKKEDWGKSLPKTSNANLPNSGIERRKKSIQNNEQTSVINTNTLSSQQGVSKSHDTTVQRNHSLHSKSGEAASQRVHSLHSYSHDTNMKRGHSMQTRSHEPTQHMKSMYHSLQSSSDKTTEENALCLQQRSDSTTAQNGQRYLPKTSNTKPNAPSSDRNISSDFSKTTNSQSKSVPIQILPNWNDQRSEGNNFTFNNNNYKLNTNLRSDLITNGQFGIEQWNWQYPGKQSQDEEILEIDNSIHNTTTTELHDFNSLPECANTSEMDFIPFKTSADNHSRTEVINSGTHSLSKVPCEVQKTDMNTLTSTAGKSSLGDPRILTNDDIQEYSSTTAITQSHSSDDEKSTTMTKKFTNSSSSTKLFNEIETFSSFEEDSGCLMSPVNKTKSDGRDNCSEDVLSSEKGDDWDCTTKSKRNNTFNKQEDAAILIFYNKPYSSPLIYELAVFARDNGFVVHDVPADGNCMFKSVEDQLRINGIFHHTDTSLRQDAVNYLRKYPLQSDGSHLKCFLEEGQSWEKYLEKMSRESEWGDHIVLNAIAEMLGRKITVIGIRYYGKDDIMKTDLEPVSSTEAINKKPFFLGHTGESHYLSLRPSNWEKIWPKVAKENRMQERIAKKISNIQEWQVIGRSVDENISIGSGCIENLNDTLAISDTASSTSQHSLDIRTSASSYSKPGNEDSTIKGSLGTHLTCNKRTCSESRPSEHLPHRDEITEQRMPIVSEETPGPDQKSVFLTEKPLDHLKRNEQTHGQDLYNHKQSAAASSTISNDGLDVLRVEQSLMIETEDIPESLIKDVHQVDQVSELPMAHLSFLFYNILPSNFFTSYAMHLTSTGHTDICGRGADMFCRLLCISSPNQELVSFKKGLSKRPIFVALHDVCVEFESSDTLNENNVYALTENVHAGYCKLRLGKRSKRYLFSNVVQENDGTMYIGKMESTTVPIIYDKKNTVAEDACFGFRCAIWPPDADEWNTRKRPSMWPNELQRDTIKNTGCMLINRSPSSQYKDDLLWRFVFSDADMYIFGCCLSLDQIHGYDIFKLLIDYQLRVILNKLKLEHIKSVFLYACETIPQDMWQNSLGGCIMYMASKLLAALKSKRLPHYFIKNNNMLDDYGEKALSDIIDRLEAIRIFPLQTLTFMTEQFELNLPILTKMLMQDAAVYVHDSDLNRTITSTFIPAKLFLAHCKVNSFYHEQAYKLLQEAYELHITCPPSRDGTPHEIPEQDKFYRDFLLSISNEVLKLLFSLHTGLPLDGHKKDEKLISEIIGGESILGIEKCPIPAAYANNLTEEGHYLSILGTALYLLRKDKDSETCIQWAIRHVKKAMKEEYVDVSEIEDSKLKKTIGRQNMENLQRWNELLLTFYRQLNTLYTMMGCMEKMREHMEDIEELRERNPHMTKFVVDLWKRLGEFERAKAVEEENTELHSVSESTNWTDELN